MTNDGFLVSRNTGPLNSQTLARYDILVIANAIAANPEGMPMHRSQLSRRMSARPSKGGSGLAGRSS